MISHHPDLTIEIEDVFGEDDRVALRLRWNAEQTGLRAVRHRRLPLRGRSHRRAVVGVHVGCMNDTARLETFSDGVFAIAATLLILEVHRRGHGSVTHELLHAWPSYAAYAISFLTIGIIWVNHHTVFQQIGRVDRTFLFINVVFLMVIAFSPFPTRVLARAPAPRLARRPPSRTA